jgi:hypothetical protein
MADAFRSSYQRRLAGIKGTPRNPLDELKEGLGGADHVAELTGRSLIIADGRYAKRWEGGGGGGGRSDGFQKGRL